LIEDKIEDKDAMPLATHTPIAFIPTAKPEAARAFYEQTLGLTFVSDDDFALVFRVGPTQTMLRVVRSGPFTPAPFTIFGWEVEDIHATVAELSGKGVAFTRYEFLRQDESGVWNAPDGSKVAWFKDPDGNTLSLSHHAV
jgi:catechol 2,3-dioxygenase-like lactoylglutathione lyase family enzyme